MRGKEGPSNAKDEVIAGVLVEATVVLPGDIAVEHRAEGQAEVVLDLFPSAGTIKGSIFKFTSY